MIRISQCVNPFLQGVHVRLTSYALKIAIGHLFRLTENVTSTARLSEPIHSNSGLLKRFTAVGICVLLLTPIQSAADEPHKEQPPQVQIEDLGSLFAGGSTYPQSINNRGQIVGFATNVQGQNVAFLWTRRYGFEELIADAFASDINNRGQAVGVRFQACDVEGSCRVSGFVWTRRAGLRELPGFVPVAINDQGDMAGYCPGFEFDDQQACAMIDGAIQFAPVSGWSFATELNSRGDVVLNADDDGVPASYVWSPRKGTLVPLAAANGDANISAFAINDRGLLVGVGSDFAAIWTRRGRFVAPRPGSYASGINNRGVAVVARNSRAMAWKVGADPVDLGTSEGEMSQAYDINDRGQIVGFRVSPAHLGETHAVIWRIQP